jgi:uncharacterized Ntn-hydrolase superfamily protein
LRGSALVLSFLLVPAFACAADMNGALSIVARDPATDEMAVAVLSHAPACGSFVPWVQAGVGAIATQGETNSTWGPRGLQLLREGVRVDRMVDSLMHSDPGFLRRQVGALDRTGGPAGYTGTELVNWSGGILDSNLTVQGNTMTDNSTLQALYDTLQAANRSVPLAERLLDALAQGVRRKADWRGARSAALLVGRPNPQRPDDASRYVYLRVDDDPDPVGKLAALYRAWRAAHLVAAHLDYAEWYRAAKAPERATREESRARAGVLAALADSSLGAPALNALAWGLAQRGKFLDQAWTAVARARTFEPKSTELTDTAAEVRFRQGRLADAVALLEEAHKAVPPDEYIAARLAAFRKLAAAEPPKKKPKGKG